jgi:hypothetical protein
MGWGKIAEYLLAFVKWVWQNKWTMLFILTTIIFLSMFGCEKRTTKNLTDELTVSKAEVAQCTANYNTVVDTNKETVKGLDVCQKELEITKKSYKDAEILIGQFDKEIEKFKKLAEDIDNEKDPDKALEKKKKIIEELFKGKNAIQIRSILRTM